jgi:hypothetical protein
VGLDIGGLDIRCARWYRKALLRKHNKLGG